MSYTKDMDEREKKTTSEEPVSLAPLEFKEALEALLKVKPGDEKKEDNKKEPKK